MTMIEADIAIIGAGPSGLFSVFQAGMLGMKSILVDCLPHIGGQCSALYPEKPIYDIPSYSKISAQDLIDNLYEQAKQFEPTILLQHKIISIDRNDFSFILRTDKEIIIEAKAVIIAVGGGAFGPNRPPISDIEAFENKSIFYSVRQKEIFKNADIAIAGGGDSAVDWAVELSKIANKVYVVHRRNKFRALDQTITKMKESKNIDLVIPYQLFNIVGDKETGQIEEILVQNTEGEIKSIKAQYLLPFFGLAMNHDFIKQWGIESCDHDSHLIVQASTMETNIKGIFAVGDIASYPGKLKLILTGFAEAALACHIAYAYVYPNKALHFEYSTSKGVAKI